MINSVDAIAEEPAVPVPRAGRKGVQGLRGLYQLLKARWPLLARLIFRLRWQRLQYPSLHYGLMVKADVSAARNIRYTVAGRGNTLTVGAWTVIDDLKLSIQGSNNRIVIGDDVRILSGVFHVEDDDTLLEIGDGSLLINTRIGLTESGSAIRIGRHGMIAPNVDIRNGDSHAIYDGETRLRINKASDVVLGDRVWVGARAMLLKGARIADGCILGACSVVSKPLLEPAALYAGSPARLLKSNIYWTRER